MNNYEFCDKLRKIEASPTRYAKGTFGQKKNVLIQKQKQYPSWYTPERMKDLTASDEDTRFYDCVGLVKSVLWTNKDGIVIYTSNGVPDINETQMFNKCTDKSKDFTNVPVGALVWMSGHVGVHVGNKLVIECTNAFTKNVCVTTFDKSRKDFPYRTWEKHGKLPYIKYEGEKAPEPIAPEPTTSIDKYVIVNTKKDVLYCREKPNGKIISSFNKGTRLRLIEKGGKWSIVEGLDYAGRNVKGYSSNQYLKEV